MFDFARWPQWPLWQCSFRPLFLVALLSGIVSVALWVVFFTLNLPYPVVPGGPIVWHAHELLAGFVLAALAGFLMTAVPEFTRTAAIDGRIGGVLALFWLVARCAFWLSGFIGPWPAAILNTGFALVLLLLLLPHMFADPLRRQTGFFLALCALVIVIGGFYFDLVRNVYPMRWLYAGIGVMMILIVMALSRVSMRIINDAIQAAREEGHAVDEDYRARPPLRNLAIFCIALYSIAEWAGIPSSIVGWLAFAVAAALLNLLNDWPVARAVLKRWVVILYVVYPCMALGYALLGYSLLWGGIGSSVGRHLLTVGAMGISILAVMCIAGRNHSGYPLDTRFWVILSAGMLLAAAVLRALAGMPGMPMKLCIALAGLTWVVAFGLALRYLAPVWLAPRPDDESGCAGI